MARLRRSDDHGFVTVWTVAISVTIFLVIGFTLDAGRLVRAQSDAYGTAAAAARIAVSQVDEVRLIEDDVTAVDRVDGEAAAIAYIEDRGYTGRVQYLGDLRAEVTVVAKVEPHMPLIDDMDFEVQATAQAIQVGA